MRVFHEEITYGTGDKEYIAILGTADMGEEIRRVVGGIAGRVYHDLVKIGSPVRGLV